MQNLYRVSVYLEQINYPYLTKFYKGREPVFDIFGIEKEVALHSEKVPLRSGSFHCYRTDRKWLFVDVNTGALQKDQELNSLQTNLETPR